MTRDQAPKKTDKNNKKPIHDFLESDLAGGIFLIVATALALFCANVPALKGLYTEFLHQPVSIGVGQLTLHKDLSHFVNDGLMALFFLLVGLEIKHEFVKGELSTRRQATLPIVAAAVGMVVPALIFIALNFSEPANLRGWAIPAATDIAFAMALIALCGKHAPPSLRVLLIAIAIIDDLGAILIIAVFYTGELSATALVLGAIMTSILVIMNLAGVKKLSLYMLIGTILWLCVLRSGVHATLAGVVVAMCIPVRGDYGKTIGMKHQTPASYLSMTLDKWVAFAIVPLFGFVNAGLSFSGMRWSDLFEPLTFGIWSGLFFGKQLGIFLTIFIMISLGFVPKIKDVNWLQAYALSLLCGIGFTMSLFIGTLAFDLSVFGNQIRAGVLFGSLISAILGFVVLRYLSPLWERHASARRETKNLTSSSLSARDA